MHFADIYIYIHIHIFQVAQSVKLLNMGWTVRGSNPGGDEIFRLSGPALGSTKSPVQWVPCLSWG